MNDLVGFDIAKGNPGAVAFMVEAYNPDKSMVELLRVEAAFKRMRKNNIQGAKLSLLWNDCCNRDTEKAIEIMRTKEIAEILEHINYEGGRGIKFED